MASRTKGYLFTVVFSFCVLLYLLSPNFPVARDFFRSFDIFSHDRGNFIFLMIVFASLGYVLTELTAYAFQLLRKVGWHTLKLGEILVSQNYITAEELDQALSEQNCKICEILLQSGRLAPTQRDNALEIQKKKYRKIGEILRELGYSTTEDIRWALNAANRSIGRILKDKNLVTDYDIKCALSVKNHHIDSDGNITL